MKKTENGQALIIILLVMAVGLTIGLSVVSRSVTDIRVSQQEEEAARALSAAEAGIEESLKAGTATDVTIGEITADVVETAQGGGEKFVFSEKVKEGETKTIWLAEHNSDGDLIEDRFYTADNLDVCWEKTDPETALEVTIFYKESSDGSYRVARGAYDAKASARGNDFEPPDSGGCAGLGRKKRLIWNDFGIDSSSDILLALRLRALYNQASVGVQAAGGGAVLPSQGRCYESTATTASGITRKVRQCQSYKTPPGIFDYVLFSKSQIVK